MPEVSIILPMYMCEAYVNGVLDMLCRQDMREIEIICVIDGSPDRTRELAEKYAAKEPRIRVIQQDHGGAGKARNTGMAAARGKYLMCPDADDIFTEDYVSCLYKAAEQNEADIAVCQLNTHNMVYDVTMKRMGYDPLKVPVNKVFSPRDLPDLFTSFYHGPKNKIFRRGSIIKNGTYFSETQSVNDQYFVTAALCCAERIIAIPDTLYTYRERHNPHSISENRAEHAADFIIGLRDLYKLLQTRNEEKQYKDSFMKCWGQNLHQFAKYDDSGTFVNAVVKELNEREPWRSMNGKELFRSIRLDTAIPETKLRLLKTRLKLKKEPSASGSLQFTIARTEREIRNISAIRAALAKSHEDMPRKGTLGLSLIRSFQDHGFRGSVMTILQRSALLRAR